MLKSPQRSLNASVKKKTLLAYSGIFTVLAVAVFGLYFGFFGKTLVSNGDGVHQHVTVLAYYGEYLRTILRNIFIEHTFTIPMFDFSIGLGNDIISTLNYYGVGDPLNLFSVFVSEQYTEYLYSVLAVLRMYIAGLTFSVYMLHRNSHSSAIVTGAVSYAFAGFALRFVSVHPFFLTGMMYIPLIFLGIDLILEKKSPVLYIASLALIIVTNFYFAYMSCIMMLFYAAMRYFEVNKKAGIKVFGKTVGVFAVYSVAAFLIPMIIFLPQIENVLATNRLNTDNIINLFYDPVSYFKIFDSLSNGQSGNYSLCIGYSGVTLLSLILCFVRGKKYKNIVMGFSLSVAALMLPYAAHVFNGFSYVTNRWAWIFAFIGAVALVYAYDDFYEISSHEKKKMFLIGACYVGLFCIVLESRSEQSMLTLLLMFVAFCLVAAGEMIGFSKALSKRILSVIILVSVLMSVSYRYDFRETSLGTDMINRGDTYSLMYNNTTAKLINTLDDDEEFYRYDDYKNTVSTNPAVVGDVNSTAFYFSFANSKSTEFLRDLGINSPMEQSYKNLDKRQILQTVFGVKYATDRDLYKFMFLVPTSEKLEVVNKPYITSSETIGFYNGNSRYISGKSFDISLFESNYALPMGYTYDSIMSYDDYKKLSAAEKQNVIMQTAVVDASAVDLPDAKLNTDTVKQYNLFDLIKKQNAEVEGIEINGNTITVTDVSAALKISVPISKNSECYMGIEKFNFNDISKYVPFEDKLNELLTEHEEMVMTHNSENDNAVYGRDKLDSYSEIKLKYDKFKYTEPDAVSVKIQSDYLSCSDSIAYYTPSNSYYSGADTFLTNIGYVLGEENVKENDTFKISFSKTGVYTFDDWYISYQNLDVVVDNYVNRTEDVLENVEILDCENTVKGTISLDETKILATQIPYSSGWSATVDGEKAEIIDVNTMFCGLVLPEGEHTVEFSYTTPHASLAVIFTVTGLIAFVVIAIIYKRKTGKAATEILAETESEE